jgi:hypothetical protein
MKIKKMKILISNIESSSSEYEIIHSYLKDRSNLFHLRRYDFEEEEVAEFLSEFSEIEINMDEFNMVTISEHEMFGWYNGMYISIKNNH